jgi:ubiquinone/menaquinone biosynthesis C-methylase UbiE
VAGRRIAGRCGYGSDDMTTSTVVAGSPSIYSNPAAYEKFMGRWSACLAPLFVHFAGVRNGQRILDVGCGTGSLSRSLLASGNAITVVGVDPTQDYVAFARQTTPDPRATFEMGAAESLPFSDESFGAALALLVLQDMEDTGRDVREMARITRRSGTVAACLWDFRDGMPMFAMFWQAAEQVAPEAVAQRRAARPSSRLGLQELAGLWNSANLSSVRTATLELSQEFTSFDDFWLPFLAGATPTCEFAVSVNRETRGELTNALRRIIPGVRPDGSFSLPARAFAVAGLARR